MKQTSKEILQEAQRMLGLSQKDFGTYIGVSARTVNSWMGKAESRSCPMYVAEMALRLAKADTRARNFSDHTSGMFRWAVIQDSGNVETLDVYGAKADAIREAEMYWNHLTDREKANQERFEVGLAHVTLSESESEPFTYFESDFGIDADVYEVAKDYLKK